MTELETLSKSLAKLNPEEQLAIVKRYAHYVYLKETKKPIIYKDRQVIVTGNRISFVNEGGYDTHSKEDIEKILLETIGQIDF